MTIGKELGRKLSVKDLGYDKASILKMVLANEAEKHHLVRFVGVVTGVRPYKIKDGERAGEIGYGLFGQFEGVSADGVTKEGSTLYLPGYVNDAIVATFQADDTINSIRIAYDVYAAYDADAATSYVFTVHDLLNTGSKTVDDIKETIAALPMPEKVKALPAPKN